MQFLRPCTALNESEIESQHQKLILEISSITSFLQVTEVVLSRMMVILHIINN